MENDTTADPPLPLQQLPTPLLMQVFASLPAPDRWSLFASPLCRAFRHALSEPSIWQAELAFAQQLQLPKPQPTPPHPEPPSTSTTSPSTSASSTLFSTIRSVLSGQDITSYLQSIAWGNVYYGAGTFPLTPATWRIPQPARAQQQPEEQQAQQQGPAAAAVAGPSLLPTGRQVLEALCYEINTDSYELKTDSHEEEARPDAEPPVLPTTAQRRPWRSQHVTDDQLDSTEPLPHPGYHPGSWANDELHNDPLCNYIFEHGPAGPEGGTSLLQQLAGMVEGGRIWFVLSHGGSPEVRPHSGLVLLHAVGRARFTPSLLVGVYGQQVCHNLCD